MNEKKKKPETIMEYIAEFSPEVQAKLQEMYSIIREVLPEGVTEKISWAMPTFYLHGNLVHFAGNKAHVGLYPGADGIETFKNEFEGRVFSKGCLQLPYRQPLPKELIQKIVRFRVDQNVAAQLTKGEK